MTFGKSFNLPGTQFPHLYIGSSWVVTSKERWEDWRSGTELATGTWHILTIFSCISHLSFYIYPGVSNSGQCQVLSLEWDSEEGISASGRAKWDEMNI